MLQKVYKLCYIRDGKLWSHYANGLPKEVIVEYKLNRRTYPPLKGSYLYASKEPLKNGIFLNKEDYALVECLAEVNTKKKPYITDASHSLENIKDLWENFPSNKIEALPYGARLLSYGGFYKTSVLCSWIKPVKIIAWKEE